MPTSSTDLSALASHPPNQSLRNWSFSNIRRKYSRRSHNHNNTPPAALHLDDLTGSNPSATTNAHEGPVPTQHQPSTESISFSLVTPISMISAPALVDDPSRGKDKDTETDKEKGSLNTTLTGTYNQSPFYRRRANVSSTSDGALSSSTSASIIKPTTPPIQSRPSLFTRLLHAVIPCVSSSPSTLHSDPEDLPSTRSEPKQPLALKERTAPRESESDPQHASSVNQNSTNPSTSAPLIIPPITIHPPPSPTDSEVIIPPPPTTLLLPDDETDGVTSGAVQPPGSTADLVRSHSRASSQHTDGISITDDEDDDTHDLEDQVEEERLIRNGGSGIPISPDGTPKPLLPPIAPHHAGKKCLVLDLDETLVHSSFRSVQEPDFIVPVEIEYHWHHFHVLKRPGVDHFLKKMGEIYEIVVFTASLSKYADPVLDKLDVHQVVAHRLFRESCFSHKGNYVKDLSQLGRPIADTIILDNSPASYIFHPNNAVPVSSWFNDPHDAELTDLIPFLADLTSVNDVRNILDGAL